MPLGLDASVRKGEQLWRRGGLIHESSEHLDRGFDRARADWLGAVTVPSLCQSAERVELGLDVLDEPGRFQRGMPGTSMVTNRAGSVWSPVSAD